MQCMPQSILKWNEMKCKPQRVNLNRVKGIIRFVSDERKFSH